MIPVKLRLAGSGSTLGRKHGWQQAAYTQVQKLFHEGLDYVGLAKARPTNKIGRESPHSEEKGKLSQQVPDISIQNMLVFPQSIVICATSHQRALLCLAEKL